MISGLVLDGRNENSEHTEAIMRIWRGKPTSESDAKRFYDIDECYHIEEKLEETNISKLKLPLLCKRSAQQFQKDEIHLDDEKKRNYDFPIASKNLKGYGYLIKELIGKAMIFCR